jgi:hypothetical protein
MVNIDRQIVFFFFNFSKVDFSISEKRSNILCVHLIWKTIMQQNINETAEFLNDF